MFGGSAAPGGWLLCDGASYSRTAFPTLFSIISTFYGSIDGSSFNVPDLRARFPLGKSAATSLGTVAGASTQTLTAAQLPAHNHTATATQGSHTHTDSGHVHSCTTPQHNHGMDHQHLIPAGQFSHSHLIGQYGGYTPGSSGFYSAQGGSDAASQTATLPQGTTNYASQTNGTWVNTGNSNQSLAFTSAAASAALSTVSAGGITVTVANSTGGGGSFAIMPPYLIVNYIIKT
jgi:microcystin-dependent protein